MAVAAGLLAPRPEGRGALWSLRANPPCRSRSRPRCSGSGWGPGLPTKSSARRQRGRPPLEGEGGLRGPSRRRWGCCLGRSPSSTLSRAGSAGVSRTTRGLAELMRLSSWPPRSWAGAGRQQQRGVGRLRLVGGRVGHGSLQSWPQHKASAPLYSRRQFSGFQATGWLCLAYGQLPLRGSCGRPGCPRALSRWTHWGVHAFPIESG